MLIHKTIQYGTHTLNVSGYYHPSEPATQFSPGEPELFEPEKICISIQEIDFEIIDLICEEDISEITELVLKACHEPTN